MDWVEGTECNLKMEKRYLPWALIPPPPRWTSNQTRLSILAEIQIQIRDGTTISAEGLFSVVANNDNCIFIFQNASYDINISVIFQTYVYNT